MPDSLILDWLNENQYRAYPLKNVGNRSFGSGLNLDTMILDAMLFSDALGPTTPAKLTNITISGGNCTINTNAGLSFQITGYMSASYPQYLRDNVFGSLLVVGEAIKGVVSTVAFTDVEFEDSVVTIFDTPWYGVFSLNFNNVYLDGGIIWEEGYQFKITADEETSVITLGANMNYGIPIGCDEFFPAVEKDCDDIISFINGVGVTNNGGNMTFIAGSNIAVYNDPDNHRIYVGLNFDTPDVCVTSLSRPSPNIM